MRTPKLLTVFQNQPNVNLGILFILPFSAEVYANSYCFLYQLKKYSNSKISISCFLRILLFPALGPILRYRICVGVSVLLSIILINLSYINFVAIKIIKRYTNLHQQMSKQYKTILTTVIQKLKNIPEKTTNILCEIVETKMTITFNRPKRLNSFSLDMYVYFTELIKKANELQEVKYIVIQGAKGNFSSGNDLSNFTNPLLLQVGELKDIVKSISQILKQLCQQMIKSKKPIFAITQGKVIGFAFTQLALFDRVYSVQNSQFVAPLVRIAQGPEMCSSYLFPKIFGFRQAQRLIALGQTVNVQYLSKYYFCQGCKNRQQAQLKLQAHLKNLDTLEWKSYLNSRRLMKQPQINNLLESNRKQIQNLVERWMDPELLQNINKHLQRVKQKPKPKL